MAAAWAANAAASALVKRHTTSAKPSEWPPICHLHSWEYFGHIYVLFQSRIIQICIADDVPVKFWSYAPFRQIGENRPLLVTQMARSDGYPQSGLVHSDTYVSLEAKAMHILTVQVHIYQRFSGCKLSVVLWGKPLSRIAIKEVGGLQNLEFVIANLMIETYRNHKLIRNWFGAMEL